MCGEGEGRSTGAADVVGGAVSVLRGGEASGGGQRKVEFGSGDWWRWFQALEGKHAFFKILFYSTVRYSDTAWVLCEEMGRCCRSGPGRKKEPLAWLLKVKMGLGTGRTGQARATFEDLGCCLTSTKGR